MARTPHITAEMLLEAGAAITLEKAQMHSMSAVSPLNSIAPCSPFSATSAAWKLSAAPSSNI